MAKKSKETLVAVGTIMTSKGKIGPGEPIPDNLSAKDLQQLKALGLVAKAGDPDVDEPAAVDQGLNPDRDTVPGLQKQIEDLQADLETEKQAYEKSQKSSLEKIDQIKTLTVDLETEREKSAGLEKQLSDLQALYDVKVSEAATDQAGLDLSGGDAGEAE